MFANIDLKIKAKQMFIKLPDVVLVTFTSSGTFSRFKSVGLLFKSLI